MKKFLAVLTLACLLTGCAAGAAGENVYETTFLTLFDTGTTIRGRAESQAAFTAAAQGVHDTLLHCHQLFDIYNDYAGCNNLKTVNDQAGVAPVEVDGDIIRLLLECRELYDATGGKVNVAMGGVLALWHDARTAGLDDPANARLPDRAALENAAAHMDFDAVIIDNAPAQEFVNANEGLTILESPWLEENYCAAVDEGNTALLEAVNTALNELIDDGTVQAIMDKYITAE